MIQVHQEQGSLTASSQAVNLDVEGLSTAVFDITGTFVGTVTFEYTIDGTKWYTLTVGLPFAPATTSTTATSPSQLRANVSGFRRVRARCSAYTSGAIGIFIRAIQGGQF